MTTSFYGPKMAYLWGNLQDGQSTGTFIKLPTGFVGKIRTHATTFRAVVISGEQSYLDKSPISLEPGS